jgi:hypothetical protein
VNLSAVGFLLEATVMTMAPSDSRPLAMLKKIFKQIMLWQFVFSKTCVDSRKPIQRLQRPAHDPVIPPERYESVVGLCF